MDDWWIAEGFTKGERKREKPAFRLLLIVSLLHSCLDFCFETTAYTDITFDL